LLDTQADCDTLAAKLNDKERIEGEAAMAGLPAC
jgi:hypothetical protein